MQKYSIIRSLDLPEYNNLRRHAGLNYQTPFDKLKTVIEVSPNY
jgi:hypothetical protein